MEGLHVASPPVTQRSSDACEFVGVPLSVLFAGAESIEAVRAAGSGVLSLEPPFHVSDEDTYLVLPDDIGLEIVDILRDGDLDLVHESMRDGLLVIGAIERRGASDVSLHAELALSPGEALRDAPPFAATVPVSGPGGTDPLAVLNALEHVQCTLLGSFFDDEGLDQVLRRDAYVGASWRVPPEDRARLAGVDPTYVWSRRLPDGRVGVELALFPEYEELVALLRPVVLTAP